MHAFSHIHRCVCLYLPYLPVSVCIVDVLNFDIIHLSLGASYYTLKRYIHLHALQVYRIPFKVNVCQTLVHVLWVYCECVLCVKLCIHAYIYSLYHSVINIWATEKGGLVWLHEFLHMHSLGHKTNDPLAGGQQSQMGWNMQGWCAHIWAGLCCHSEWPAHRGLSFLLSAHEQLTWSAAQPNRQLWTQCLSNLSSIQFCHPVQLCSKQELQLFLIHLQHAFSCMMVCQQLLCLLWVERERCGCAPWSMTKVSLCETHLSSRHNVVRHSVVIQCCEDSKRCRHSVLKTASFERQLLVSVVLEFFPASVCFCICLQVAQEQANTILCWLWYRICLLLLTCHQGPGDPGPPAEFGAGNRCRR
jgi:hypothetical protein